MTFLIARPLEKALKTQALFMANQYSAEILPVINIDTSNNPLKLHSFNKALPKIIIVTSTYAADWLAEKVIKQTLTFDITTTIIACIGASTAKSLSKYIKANNIVCAEPENSEGLLTLSCFDQVEALSIVLLKGESGRELITQTLKQNKANLTVIDVYQRTINKQALQSFTFEQSTIQCMIATSVEIIAALINYLDKNELANLQWVVASGRIKEYAMQQGIRHIEVSHGASDQALLECAQKLVNTGAVND